MLSVYEGMTALFVYEKLLGGSSIPKTSSIEGKAS